MSDVSFAKMPRWAQWAWIGFGLACAYSPRIVTSKRLDAAKEDRAVKEMLGKMLEEIQAKWAELHPEDYVTVVHRPPEGSGRASVYSDKWLYHLSEGEEVVGPAEVHR